MDSCLFPVRPPPSRTRAVEEAFDLAVVGATALGLAHALTAARHGRRVVVIDAALGPGDADPVATGLVAVTGRPPGMAWCRAYHGAEQWDEVAQAMGLAPLGRGAYAVARSGPEAQLLEAVMDRGDALGCRLYRPAQAPGPVAPFEPPGAVAVLESPFERRFDPVRALGLFAAWLAEVHGVRFRWASPTLAVTDLGVETVHGTVRAATVAVCCPQAAFRLYRDGLAARGFAPAHAMLLRSVAPVRTGGAPPALIRSASCLAACLGARDKPPASGESTPGLPAVSGPGAVGRSRDVAIVPDSLNTVLLGPFVATAGAEPERALAARTLAQAAEVLGARPRLCERRGRILPTGPNESVVIEAGPGRRIIVAPPDAGFGDAFALSESVLDDLMGLSRRIAV